MQCSHRFLTELCTFMPLVCCWKAITPPGPAAWTALVAVDVRATTFNVGRNVDCRLATKGEEVCERLRPCCGVDRVGCTRGVSDSARSEAVRREAEGFCKEADLEAMIEPAMLADSGEWLDTYWGCPRCWSRICGGSQIRRALGHFRIELASIKFHVTKHVPCLFPPRQPRGSTSFRTKVFAVQERRNRRDEIF